MAAKTFNPLRRQTGLHFEPRNEGLRITDESSGRSLTLGTAESLLWGYLDGTHSAGELAAAMSVELGTHVEVEEVWRSLDGLSDLGLLEVRVAPPAGDSPVGRRRFLQFGSALLAGSVSALAPVAAFADCPVNFDPALPENAELLAKEMDCKATDVEQTGKEISGKSAESNAKGQEQNLKEQEQRDKQQAQQEVSDKMSQESAQKSYESSTKEIEYSDKEYDAKGGEAGEKDRKLHAEYLTKSEENLQKSYDEYQLKGGSTESINKNIENVDKASKGIIPPGGGLPPIPEPSTVYLFGIGLAALAGAAWQRLHPAEENDFNESQPHQED